VDVRSGTPFEYFASHVRADGSLNSTWNSSGEYLCLGAADGLHQTLCSDGAAGYYVSWVDGRAGDPGVFLQHIGANGQAAEIWPEGGRPVCQAPRSQYNIALASDGEHACL
jgi:hypothetical protein